ncbi:MAG: undecaprenyl/decaprenyl-phosphate alpha-N-acetylglucosaminyl 1-phosphate transferase, partial [Aquificae bacterium]|nr:undecaprenyl/decaprenyl-phosphate alpha-N-acetylglucosaminyl 1-phosphate transferase [Aquificota bacterium]
MESRLFIYLYFFPFFLSLIINFFIMFLSKRKQIFLDKIDKNHGLYKSPIPRIGGIGIYLSFGIASIFLSKTAFYLWLSALPVFLVGLLEDLKGDIPPKLRLVIIAIGAILGIVLLDAVIINISITELPLFLAIPFTIFAIVGITNAINMVDGFNGLASGIVLISLISMFILSLKLKDFELAMIIITLVSSILGFFILNFPKAKIFLGDSGAYTLGFMVGIISILLLKRHPEVSPWFPVVLLAYPITDVLFSIFRRVFIQKTSPFKPDKLHFHSLIYK